MPGFKIDYRRKQIIDSDLGKFLIVNYFINSFL